MSQLIEHWQCADVSSAVWFEAINLYIDFCMYYLQGWVRDFAQYIARRPTQRITHQKGKIAKMSTSKIFLPMIPLWSPLWSMWFPEHFESFNPGANSILQRGPSLRSSKDGKPEWKPYQELNVSTALPSEDISSSFNPRNLPRLGLGY